MSITSEHLIGTSKAALRAGDKEQGRALLVLADKLSESSDALVQLSRHYDRNGKTKEAVLSFSHALRKTPESFSDSDVAEFARLGLHQAVSPAWAALWSGIKCYEKAKGGLI